MRSLHTEIEGRERWRDRGREGGCYKRGRDGGTLVKEYHTASMHAQEVDSSIYSLCIAHPYVLQMCASPQHVPFNVDNRS